MLATTNLSNFATFQRQQQQQQQQNKVKDANLTLNNLSLMGTMMMLDEMDSTVDSNFQLVLRKMNKKDSTTKLKVKF